LLEVLWAYKCTLQYSTKETTFSLVFDIGVMIPVEIGEPALHQKHNNEDLNEAYLNTNLDLLVERREKSHI